MLEFLLRFPRLLVLLIGAACIATGWQFFGDVRREDAPVRRALGPSGIPVEVVVIDRTTSYPKFTTVQYDYDGVRHRGDVMGDPVVERAALGSRLAYRLDPQNPRFGVRADAPVPSTIGKQIVCVLVLVAGVLIVLGVFFSWIR